MSFKLNPNLERELIASLAPKIEAAAKTAALILKANVGSSSHGTGRKYSSLPHRSSAPGTLPMPVNGEAGLNTCALCHG